MMQFTSSLSAGDPTSRSPASVYGLVPNADRDGPNSWLQIPPTHMPWGDPAAHQPSIVRFTAEPLDKPGPSGFNSALYGQCKRKIEPELVLPAAKQLITEEKMAAHMRQLHISNSYTSHEEPAVNIMPTGSIISPESETSQISMPTMPAEERAYKRLVLCEEIRQLQNEPLLPPSLLSQMQRPSMALVLWQPPAGRMGDALSEVAAAAAAKTEEEEQKQTGSNPCVLPRRSSQFPSMSLDNNNSSSAINLNTMHRFGEGLFQSSEPQAMDL